MNIDIDIPTLHTNRVKDDSLDDIAPITLPWTVTVHEAAQGEIVLVDHKLLKVYNEQTGLTSGAKPVSSMTWHISVLKEPIEAIFLGVSTLHNGVIKENEKKYSFPHFKFHRTGKITAFVVSPVTKSRRYRKPFYVVDYSHG